MMKRQLRIPATTWKSQNPASTSQRMLSSVLTADLRGSRGPQLADDRGTPGPRLGSADMEERTAQRPRAGGRERWTGTEPPL